MESDNQDYVISLFACFILSFSYLADSAFKKLMFFDSWQKNVKKICD